MAYWHPGLLPMVEVIIDSVFDGRDQERDLDAITGLMLHRVGLNLRAGVVIGYDAMAICNAFLGRIPQWQSVAKTTGGQNPYTFLIGGGFGPTELDGHIWQALPLDEIGHHGRRFSRNYLGIGLIGDFRERVPSARQWRSAIDLCSDLALMLTVAPSNIVGHGEIEGAHGGNKAPGRRFACPGDLWSMATFRLEVAEEMAAKAVQDSLCRLESIGVRLP